MFIFSRAQKKSLFKNVLFSFLKKEKKMVSPWDRETESTAHEITEELELGWLRGAQYHDIYEINILNTAEFPPPAIQPTNF